MGSTSTVAELYRTHGAAVLRRARRLLDHDADAREILQEVFTRLVDDPSPLQGCASPMALLYRATTNRCLNRIRDRGNRQRLIDGEAERLTPVAAADAESRAQLLELLATLPEDHAVALVFHHVDGMSHAEIAEQLGCSRRHVGDLLERAKIRLNQMEAPPC
jgi:RNA polymerase sigma-70 factor, ECF subfamily